MARTSILVFLLLTFASCSTENDSTGTSPTPLNESAPLSVTQALTTQQTDHFQLVVPIEMDPESREIRIVPDRAEATHLDLTWFWKYYFKILSISIVDYNLPLHQVTLEIKFTNPLDKPLRDVRAIYPLDGILVPVNVDGWSTRDGSPPDNPSPYVAFGKDFPNRTIDPNESDAIQIVFQYEPPLNNKTASFMLDATVDNNTAEPYEISNPDITGRFFSISISDWQDDITTAFLDVRPMGFQVPLRLAKFGQNGEWGTSIPDLPANMPTGDFSLLVTAKSPETPGEIGDENPAIGYQWVDLHWPPDDPIIPLPRGRGIFGYSFIDPDTNLPPTNAPAFMKKFREDMSGDWLIIEFGEICNSGYLAMNSWVPIYIEWMHSAAPEMPIHLNIDNLGFVTIDQDPCHHPPENYTEAFFDHLLESIRGQILENPDFDLISGIHFDIEIFPQQYSYDQLATIYRRYADFLGRLHKEPDLRGRNITVYDFDWHPHAVEGDLAYLCTADAAIAECYYSRFTYEWSTEETETPFDRIQKILGIYHSWAMEYGRPYYPILATFSGWMDGNMDTLGSCTLCPGQLLTLIDDHCFGKGAFLTINEFDIVKATDIHGKVVERVLLNLPTGEPIFPATGYAVYDLGDGVPSTVSDDYVFCCTAYAMSRLYWEVRDAHNPYIPGMAIFRFENNSYWKAPAYTDALERGSICAVSGRIRFSDGLGIQQHPELWGNITISLLAPLTPEILNNPAYRKSIDIVGVCDGSYILPDLPTGTITIQASAPGWKSDPVTLEMKANFEYRANVDLMMKLE